MSKANTMLAVAAMAMMASSPMAVSEQNLGYAMPKAWAPNVRSGNNRSASKRIKARAKAKMAAKSRRDQRKAAKR